MGKTIPAPKIDLDCKDLDVRVILQWIAKAWDMNILAAGDVRGTVTKTLSNVPADELLNEILFEKDLVGFQEKDFLIVRSGGAK